MSWRFSTGHPVPGDHIRLGQGQFRNIFYVGELLTFPLAGTGTVASWEVIDHTGLTVSTGGPFTAGSTWTLPASLGPGWYRVLFRRSGTVTGWADAQGGGMFIVARNIPGMPPRPPASLPNTGWDTTLDVGLSSLLLMGPMRFDADVDDPTVQQGGVEAGLDQLATYYHPYDTTRPKSALMSFSAGTDLPDPAAAAANVGAVVDLYPAITHFEGQNEPNGVPGAVFAPVQQRFYQNVKAARADALVCGPCPVTVNGSALETLRAFYAAGGGDGIDVTTFHTYNAHVGDLPTGRRTWEAWKALLTEFGQWGKPRMNTEAASFFGAEFGAGTLMRQAHWTILDLFLHEQYGVQKEAWSIFYTTSHGFWDYPSFIENETPAAYPVVAALLTHAQELLGTAFEARLDFGTVDNDTLIGSSHRRANGTGVVALLSAGRAAAEVRLQVTGGVPASLVTVDGYGRETTVTVTGGLATLTVGSFGSYVRLPAGITATPVDGDTRWGTRRSTGATATATGGSKGLSSLAQVLNGPWRNKLYFSSGNVADAVSVWQSNAAPTGGNPVDVTVTLPAPAYVDTVLVHCPPAWQGALSVIRDADVQVLNNGTWTTVATFGYEPRLETFVSTHLDGVNGFYENWDADVHVFELRFPRVVASQVRLHVREVSAGGAPVPAALTGFGATDSGGAPVAAGMGNPTPTLALQRLAVYDSESAEPPPPPSGIAGTGKYVVVAGSLA